MVVWEKKETATEGGEMNKWQAAWDQAAFLLGGKGHGKETSTENYNEESNN